jgi:hypothetical protein
MNVQESTTHRIILSWLNNLSRLVRHTEEKPTKDQLGVYSVMLAKDLPSGAFTEESLHHVAQGMTFWPDYDSVRKKALAWWRDHKPAAAPALADEREARTRLSYWDQRWLDYYNKRRPELSGNEPGLRNLQSLVRDKSPLAWRIIEGDPLPSEWPGADQVDALCQTIEANAGPLAKVIARVSPPSVVLSGEQLAENRQAALERMHEMAARNVR